MSSKIPVQKMLFSRPLCQFKPKQPARTSINVTLLGVNLRLGRYTSLLLKQNPIVKFLNLYGDTCAENLATDLNQIDTSCVVNSFDLHCVSNALLGSDVVLILPSKTFPETTPIADRLLCEGKRILELSDACTKFAPKATIVCCVPPISVTTCLVEEIFTKTQFYHPGRILGAAIYAQMRANTLLASYQHLDPFSLHVPVIGGPDIDLAVPLFTSARPAGVDLTQLPTLLAKYRNVPLKTFPKHNKCLNHIEHLPLSEAFALHQLVTLIGFGLCGDENVRAACFVRSGLVDHCQHLVSTVQFGKHGIIHNFGIPKLTRLELELFEQSLLEIKERERMAKQLISHIQEETVQPPPFKLQQLRDENFTRQKIYPQ